jgi:hypothetical protein
MREGSIRKIRLPERSEGELKVVDVSKRKHAKERTRLNLKALVLFLALAAVLSTLAVPAAGKDPEAGITVRQGTAEILGGGSFVSYESGASSVRIIYGNQVENSVYIMHSFPRHLAVLETRRPDGSFSGRHSLEADTVVFHELRFLMEYEGSPKASIVIPKSLSGVTDKGAIKALSFSHSWDLVESRETDDGEFVVSLSLTDQEYDYAWDGDEGQVAGVFLTITTRVTEAPVMLDDLPSYRATLKEKSDRIDYDSIEPVPGKRYEGKSVTWSTKYGIRVEGWEFHEDDSALLLASRTFFGDFPRKGTTDWAGTDLASRIGAGARAEGVDMDDFEAEEVPSPVRFVDNWRERAVLSWAGQEVLVDGKVREQPRLHLLKAEKESVRMGEEEFSGVGLDGVFAYPQGEVIRHDPTLVSTFLDFNPIVLIDLLPGGAVLAQVAVTALGTAAAFTVAYSRGQKGAKKRGKPEGDERDEGEP